MVKKIRTLFIFEMIGKPPEYLKENLESYIKSLQTEGVKLLSKKIHEPKPIEAQKTETTGLFCSFAEVELEIDNLNLLFGITFRMLPSHVEVIEPADFNLKNFDLSAIISDLAIKLHKYDEVVKVLMMERDNLNVQLNTLKARLGSGVKVEEIKKDDKSVNKKDKKKKK